jgi:cell division protein FtsB
MRRRMTFKRFAQGMIVPAGCVALISYFSWHGFYGEYGAFKLARLDERVAIRTAELDQISAERERLERRVHLMEPGHVDPDMLDEQSRTSLGYSRPDELTIYWGSVTR